MRSLLKGVMAAVFAATLHFADAPMVLAQQADEASELNKRATELYNAGRYADAIPIVQRFLPPSSRAARGQTM
jgi:hypothetical protein